MRVICHNTTHRRSARLIQDQSRMAFHTAFTGCPLRYKRSCARISGEQRMRAHVTRASLESIHRKPTEQCLNTFHLYGRFTNHKCREAVHQYFEEIWNNSNLDLLDELTVDNVLYAEKNIYDEDFVGRNRVRKIIAEYQRAYPDMKFAVDKIICDEYCESAMAHWTAKGSCLGKRMNFPASGKRSQLSGMTMFSFDCHGLIYEVINFRTQLAEEAAISQIDWE